MRRTNIKGHALRSEGKPYVLGGDDQDPYVRNQTYQSGGYALCECGATSGWLSSDGRRKRWHADHKAQITSKD